MPSIDELLGRGVLRPFIRDEKHDFANAAGEQNVRACVGQVLGTRRGEVRWRRAFGADLHLLLHRPQNPALEDYAALLVRDALQRWEPRVRLRSVRVQKREAGVLGVEVLYVLVDPQGRVAGQGSTSVAVGASSSA